MLIVKDKMQEEKNEPADLKRIKLRAIDKTAFEIGKALMPEANPLTQETACEKLKALENEFYYFWGSLLNRWFPHLIASKKYFYKKNLYLAVLEKDNTPLAGKFLPFGDPVTLAHWQYIVKTENAWRGTTSLNAEKKPCEDPKIQFICIVNRGETPQQSIATVARHRFPYIERIDTKIILSLGFPNPFSLLLKGTASEEIFKNAHACISNPDFWRRWGEIKDAWSELMALHERMKKENAGKMAEMTKAIGAIGERIAEVFSKPNQENQAQMAKYANDLAKAFPKDLFDPSPNQETLRAAAAAFTAIPQATIDQLKNWTTRESERYIARQNKLIEDYGKRNLAELFGDGNKRHEADIKLIEAATGSFASMFEKTRAEERKRLEKMAKGLEDASPPQRFEYDRYSLLSDIAVQSQRKDITKEDVREIIREELDNNRQREERSDGKDAKQAQGPGAGIGSVDSPETVGDVKEKKEPIQEKSELPTVIPASKKARSKSAQRKAEDHGTKWITYGESSLDDRFFCANNEQLAKAMQNSGVPRYVEPFGGKKTPKSKMRTFIRRIAEGAYNGVIITVLKDTTDRIHGYAIIRNNKDDTLRARANTAIAFIEKLKATPAPKSKSTKRPSKKESA